MNSEKGQREMDVSILWPCRLAVNKGGAGWRSRACRGPATEARAWGASIAADLLLEWEDEEMTGSPASRAPGRGKPVSCLACRALARSVRHPPSYRAIDPCEECRNRFDLDDLLSFQESKVKSQSKGALAPSRPQSLKERGILF